MKSSQEIKKAAETARTLVNDLYANDPRLKNPKQQTPDSGVTQEMKIVFQETLRYMLNN